MSLKKTPMSIYLQTIIGTDKKNPYFTILKNNKDNILEVYFGGALLEKIQNTKDNPALKHLVARLFNSGVKRKSLTENFGYSYNAIKRWAEALQTGDAEIIMHALSGQGAPLKVTKEIESFVTHRFISIYPTNKYSYSKEIIDEISDIFKVRISPETLRPLFNRIKEEHFKKKQIRINVD